MVGKVWICIASLFSAAMLMLGGFLLAGNTHASIVTLVITVGVICFGETVYLALQKGFGRPAPPNRLRENGLFLVRHVFIADQKGKKRGVVILQDYHTDDIFCIEISPAGAEYIRQHDVYTVQRNMDTIVSYPDGSEEGNYPIF